MTAFGTRPKVSMLSKCQPTKVVKFCDGCPEIEEEATIKCEISSNLRVGRSLCCGPSVISGWAAKFIGRCISETIIVNKHGFLLLSVQPRGHWAHRSYSLAGAMVELPRLPMSVLDDDPKMFVSAMEEHGMVVLTAIGDGKEAHASLIRNFQEFCSQTDEEKAKGTSRKVYRSERGVPMWYCGFEAGDMREAFRVPTGMKEIDSWPSEEFEQAWLSCTEFLQTLCDKCLSITLDKPIARPQGKDDDKSVSYAVHYPNNRGGQQAEGINIKEHVDPSLYVMEPVVDEPGLDVFHKPSNEWIQVESACRPGEEIIVFGGAALERATEGRIKAALHRVSHKAEQNPRFVFLFEQKYADFFPPPAFDD